MYSAECCGHKHAVNKGQWIECPECGASITHKPLKANKAPVAEVPCRAGLSCEDYAFCDACKTIKSIIKDPPGESYDGKFIGGDIICECGHMIATLYRKAI